MAAMRFEQVQRFILAKKIFWVRGTSTSEGHIKPLKRRTSDSEKAQETAQGGTGLRRPSLQRMH